MIYVRMYVCWDSKEGVWSPTEAARFRIVLQRHTMLSNNYGQI